MLKGVDIIPQGEFYDIVQPESYSGAPINWVKEEGKPFLDPEKVSRLIECGKLFYDLSWANGTSGNLSFKSANGIGVTATRTELGKLTKEDIVEVTNIHYEDEAPTVFFKAVGDKKPTSEVLAHWEIYKSMPHIKSILHGHDKLTTKMARIISNHSPDIVGRTNNEPLQGTKEFADDLKIITRKHRRYLIAKGHGFFSLGEDFNEALGYAQTIHFITRISRIPVSLRRRIDPYLPKFLKGITVPITDRFEGLVTLDVKYGVTKSLF